MEHSGGLRMAGVSCHDFAYLNSKVHEAKQMTSASMFHRLTGHDRPGHESVSYMLSASSLLVLQSRYVYDAIKGLLNKPKTTIILLVPVKLIVHSAALKLSRLLKAPGSTLRIFPFDPLSTAHDEDVVRCIRYGVKDLTRVDGYMSFEEDGDSKMRISAIARLANG